MKSNIQNIHTPKLSNAKRLVLLNRETDASGLKLGNPDSIPTRISTRQDVRSVFHCSLSIIYCAQNRTRRRPTDNAFVILVVIDDGKRCIHGEISSVLRAERMQESIKLNVRSSRDWKVFYRAHHEKLARRVMYIRLANYSKSLWPDCFR
ncbi:hypothetical protein BDP27DRAFT_525469 [Rhodocollybia butyracea]|uniref:Uncharacterized protein n=1 Tax=Rhodocollybia butyracea TaxID=206335 RepID=A0A9P5PS72_9AGAR|nr:hypothetical protein BDP27DRAFT_525469 [Rhodocollybia butyracea]